MMTTRIKVIIVVLLVLGLIKIVSLIKKEHWNLNML